MKRFLISIALMTLPLYVMATSVGVSVNVGSPDYYGQLQLGNMPSPQVIYGAPVIIQQTPGGAYPPIYLRVPQQHYRHWRHHCRAYNACNRPVYFVQDNWYLNSYVPRYRLDNPQWRHSYEREYRHDNRRGYERDHYDRNRHNRRDDNGRVHIQIDDHGKAQQRHHDHRR